MFSNVDNDIKNINKNANLADTKESNYSSKRNRESTQKSKKVSNADYRTALVTEQHSVNDFNEEIELDDKKLNSQKKREKSNSMKRPSENP